MKTCSTLNIYEQKINYILLKNNLIYLQTRSICLSFNVTEDGNHNPLSDICVVLENFEPFLEYGSNL